jgi:cysteine-rich repeat protein
VQNVLDKINNPGPPLGLIRLGPNFDGGEIDLSYNYLQGDWGFSFRRDYDFDLPIVHHTEEYFIDLRYNRLNITSRDLPPRRSPEMNVNYVIGLQDVDDCATRTDLCEHICIDGWRPALAYTCGCHPGFKLKDDLISCVPDFCTGDGWIVGIPFGNETCDFRGRGCDQYCQVERGYDCPKNVGCRTIISTTKKNLTMTQYRPISGIICENAGCTNICGDGIVVPGEDCDFGPRNGPEGPCSKTCKTNKGYTCIGMTGSSNQCQNVCGDGVTVPPEKCDPGNTALTRSALGCSSTCTILEGYQCKLTTAVSNLSLPVSDCSPVCGDGLVVEPEECDWFSTDFSNNERPGCDKNCRVKTGKIISDSSH